MATTATARTVAQELCSFVDASPSPFHTVAAAKAMLLQHGFRQLSEQTAWNAAAIQKGHKYFVTRNASTIVAFAVGGKYTPGSGFNIIGAHTDSPCLKVKPRSNVENLGYMQVGTEVYGGGLWHTWFDRDLSLAGRVVVRKGEALESKLIRFDRPILRVPSLAIHLNRELSSEGFKFNNENHLLPILSSLSAVTSEPKSDTPARHHPAFLRLVAEKAGVEVSDIMDFELSLHDTQPSTVGGAFDEYIFAPRLDNLASSFAATKGLIDSLPTLADDERVRVVCLFDHEEIGSQSAHGADSLLVEQIMRRIDNALSPDSKDDSFQRAMACSFLVSADMAHAVHPNYGDKHEARHRPAINQGVVIKFNANQRYATTSVTSSLLRLIGSSASVPLQEFAVRNDMPCGSTIGPILSSKLGIRTIDVGCAMLSMHSIREMAGTTDVLHAINLYSNFFSKFTQMDRKHQSE